MKKLILSLLAIATISLSSFGQAPEGFKYQAVIRDASSLILTSQPVGIQLMIRQGSAGGSAVYTETFSPTTNGYGLVNLEIGTGTTTDDFTLIDWANGPYFIETSVDVTGGVAYQVMGTNQLMSVPYALYAKTAENVANDLVDDADSDSLNEIQDLQFSPFLNYLTITNNGAATIVDLTPYLDNTDTQLDSIGIANLGYVAGSHTVDTDTQLDSTDIANFGYVAEKTYTIGMWPELGGYVFWISADGKHGLVAETVDQSSSSTWYEAQNVISDPLNHSVDGEKFRDWRMPTKFELYEMYLQKGAIGGFANFGYWSSTEVDSGDAWVQSFSFGGQSSLGKGLNYYVRSVRAF